MSDSDSPAVAGASYDRSARLRKPAETRFDRFAIFHLGREHDLSALDCWVLVSLVFLCDWRTGDWLGTITELAEDVRAPRRSVAASLVRLRDAELIQDVKPFGPKRQGHLRLLALDQLVTDAKPVNRAEPRENTEPHLRARPEPNRAEPRDTEEEPSRADVAHQSRVNRAPTAQNGATPPAATCDDAQAQGSKRRRGEGATKTRDNAQAIARLEQELDAETIKVAAR